jgi:hypothetical protein
MLRVDHFAGGPLSHAMPATQPVANGADVRLTVVAMEKPVRAIGDPLGSHAQLVSVAQGNSPVLPVAMLTEDVRVVLVDGTSPFERNLKSGSLGRTAALPELESVLAKGTTSRFEVIQVRPQKDALSGRTAQRRFRLELSPGEQDRVQAALVVEDFVGGNSQQRTFQTEAVLLDPLETKSPVVVMIVPFTVSDTRGFALTVEVGRLFDASRHDALVARCQSDILAAAAAARPLPTTLPTDEQFALRNALDALARHPDDRAALVFLADQTDAHLCAGAAIVADSATLTRLSQSIVKQSSAAASPKQTGWLLDRSTLELLSSQLAAENLSPELAAVLTEYAGEAGRHAASIEEAMRVPDNRPAVETALVAENLIFLEDTSPSARVRSYDWLTEHGKAPKGYDPLGPPRARRDALENALAAAATQPAEGGNP